MYHKRLIDSYLIAWKSDANRKPLLVRGARQVGKSSAVRQLALQFDDFVEINFEQQKEIHNLFHGTLDAPTLLERLSVVLLKRITPGKTLVFFDEIQACPNAITSLRYFYEQIPALHVIAAGSLLEFALQTLPSFGVGRIRSVFMYPFSFDEFLSASGQELLLEMKNKVEYVKQALPEPIHNKLLEQLRVFLVVGGMPEVVVRYVETGSLLDTQLALDDLINSLRSDFDKYKQTVPALRLRETLSAVVMQAGKKFVYARVSEQIKDAQAKEALELLILAGWVIPVTHTAANGIPIGAEIDPKRRKMVLLDTGVFQRLLGLDVSKLYLDDQFVFVNKGVLAEQLWALEYIKYQSPTQYPELYYWHREVANANAEVDYLVQKGADILPVEVKSSGKGSMQSLRVFLAEKGRSTGFRFSLESWSAYQDVESWPLYNVRSFLNILA